MSSGELGKGAVGNVDSRKTTRLPTLPTAPTTTTVALFSVNKWPSFRLTKTVYVVCTLIFSADHRFYWCLAHSNHTCNQLEVR